jgi:polysaccharide biosynthesis transport protein
MSEIKNLPGETVHLEGEIASAPAQENAGFSIDYRRLLETAKKYFWVFILYLIAGLSAATVYLVNATPIYRSTARLQVEQRVMAPNPTNGMDPAEDLRGLEMLQTIQLGFVSRSLMARMVEGKSLKTRADFTKSTPLEGEVDEEAYIQYLLGNTDCQLIQGTRLMTLSFDHPDPHVAQEMVDSFVQEYILLGREQRLSAASVNLSYLIEETKVCEENLRRAEEKLSDYTRETGSVSVEGADNANGGINIVAAQLVQLNDRLGVAKAERAKLESDNEQISKFRDDPKALLEIASVSELPVITTLRGQLNVLDGDISQKKQIFKPNNPQLKQAESQRATLQKAMEAEALRAPQTLERSLQAAIQNEATLQRDTDALEQKVIKNKEMSIKAKDLEHQITAATEAYQAVLRKYAEERSQATSQPVFIEVVDAASPAFKVKPKVLQTLAIAAILSLILAAATIFLLANLDTSFKSVDELEAALGIQVLAAIPHYEVAKGKKGKEALAAASGPSVALPLLDDPYSAASEAYRTLRASLLLVEDESHSILVTSAVPEEGKSTTSINLAISMAQRGARTLLIEADLRKPVLQKRLIGPDDHLGVSDFLNDHADFDEIVQATAIPNLSILSAGRVNKNSGELLLRRPRVEKLLELARKGFEQVIVDSAPLLAVSDTLTIARHFHVINLVVRSHKTPRRSVKRAFDLLKRIRRAPIGVALSMVPPGNAYYYYSYGEGGDRAYGSGHQAAAEEKT